MELTLQHYLILAAALFAIGAIGAVTRRNILIVLMSLELMLTAGVLAFLSFARWNLMPDGGALAVLIIALIAGETAVGLAIVVAVLRKQGQQGKQSQQSF